MYNKHLVIKNTKMAEPPLKIRDQEELHKSLPRLLLFGCTSASFVLAVEA